MVRLQEKLGEGASATVYKGVFEADDEKAKLDSRTIIGDPVAVKMFSNGKSEHTKFGSNFSSRLLQSMEHMTQHHEQSMTHNGGIIEDVDGLSLELRRLVSARHLNIVTPKGYIGMRPQGESGLVMELMDESLHDYLEKVNDGSLPPLKELDMLDLMLEIAKGMRFLHECDLIHRDLKPQNVLLRFPADYEDLGCKLLEVKLADFGHTKLCDFAQGGSSMYMHTSGQGTSCYMAPELRGDAPSQESPYQFEKVDVFSYGTTCFNIVTRNPNALAFSQSVKAFYKAVKTGEWKQWVQDFDNNLGCFVNLIARCWQAEPACRPTFAELCVLLQAAMQECLLRRSFYKSLKFQHSNVSRTSMASSLSNLQKGFKSHHSYVYRTIMAKMLDTYKGFGGVRAITKCFLDFESTIPAHHKTNQPPTRFQQIFPNDGAQTSDFARDVSIFVEAMRKGHFNAGKKQANTSYSTLCLIGFFLVDSYFNKTDPLLFIKGLACFKLIHQYYLPVEGSSTLSSTCAKYRDFKYDKYISAVQESRTLSSTYAVYGDFKYDYKNDEAFCELEVDTSLIPLLVGLWLVGTDSYCST